MQPSEECPDCGSPVDINATAGFCSTCLLGSVVESNKIRSNHAELNNELPWDVKIPGLKLGEIIGRGAMGIVFKAHQALLNRNVAVKVLNPQLSEEDKFVEHFFDEAQAMAALNHPNIVTVYDIGKTEEGALYIAMEWVEGTDLRSLIEQGEISTDHALMWVPQICEALQGAHNRGIVHRDVKPSNIMINLDGNVKVTDFGIAKMAHHEGTTSLNSGDAGMGTPDYVAPEQLIGNQTADHRADLYSLGVTLYEMLTGSLPGATFTLPSQRSAAVDRRFDSVVDRAMKVNPNERYQTASEITQDLRYMTQDEVKLRREQLKQKWALGSMLAAVVILSAICVNILFIQPPSPQPKESPNFVSYRVKSDDYRIRPWRHADVWGDNVPGKFPESAVNSGFKNDSFVLEKSTTLLTEELTRDRLRIFGGRDLVLNPTTSLEMWGSGDGITVVPNLILAGGRLAAGASLPSETDLSFFPSFTKRALFPQEKSTERDLYTLDHNFRLIGNLQVLANSLLDVGLRRTESIDLDSTITGDSTLTIRRRAGRGKINITRDNPDFSGGWRIAGWCSTDSLLALGTGPVHIERGGTLFVKSPLELSKLTIEPGGVIQSNSVIFTKSLLDAENYRKENPDQKLQIDFATAGQACFRGTGRIESKGVATPVSHDGIPRPKSGSFWERPEHYVTLSKTGKGDWTTSRWKGGEAPGFLKVSKNEFQFEKLSDYAVPSRATLRTPSAIRGEAIFGGKSLTLHEGAVLLFQSEDGIVNFPRLISCKGEIAIHHQAGFVSNPELKGVLDVPSQLTIRLTPESKKHLFSLDSQLRGKGEVVIDFEDSTLFLTQPFTHFEGTIRVKSGTLLLPQSDFRGANFILEKGAVLQNQALKSLTLGDFQVHPDAVVYLHKGSLTVPSLTIGDQEIPGADLEVKSFRRKFEAKNFRSYDSNSRIVVME